QSSLFAHMSASASSRYTYLESLPPDILRGLRPYIPYEISALAQCSKKMRDSVDEVRKTYLPILASHPMIGYILKNSTVICKENDSNTKKLRELLNVLFELGGGIDD